MYGKHPEDPDEIKKIRHFYDFDMNNSGVRVPSVNRRSTLFVRFFYADVFVLFKKHILMYGIDFQLTSERVCPRHTMYRSTAQETKIAIEDISLYSSHGTSSFDKFSLLSQ